MLDVINKERRDTVLEILNANHPYGVGNMVIEKLVAEAGFESSEKQVESDLGYLEDKGFVKIETVGNKQYGMKRMLAKLTAAGMDHIEGVR